MFRDPLNAERPLDLSDYSRDELGRPCAPVGLGGALGSLGSTGEQLRHLYDRYVPVEQKFGIRFEFPKGVVRTDLIRRTQPVERYDMLIADYRWAWSWQIDGRLTVPITIAYGSSVEKTLSRPAFITAVWGSVLRWAPPPRVQVIRPGRKLIFEARLDYGILPIDPPQPDDVVKTVLDVTIDAVELRPR